MDPLSSQVGTNCWNLLETKKQTFHIKLLLLSRRNKIVNKSSAKSYESTSFFASLSFRLELNDVDVRVCAAKRGEYVQHETTNSDWIIRFCMYVYTRWWCLMPLPSPARCVPSGPECLCVVWTLRSQVFNWNRFVYVDTDKNVCSWTNMFRFYAHCCCSTLLLSLYYFVPPIYRLPSMNNG